MAIINHAKREINAKIIYFGPEGAGKATAMRYVYDRIKPALRGELKNVPASGSDLIFFDFRPFEQTLSGGYSLYLHIYTLHGKVNHSAAWKMTLKGADGVVILADTSPGMLTATHESILQLREILSGYGMSLDELPCVLLMNKADLSESLAEEHLDQVTASLGVNGMSSFLSSAKTGQGILEALTALSRQVIERISAREDLKPVYGFAVETGGNGERTVDVVVEPELPEADLLEMQTDEASSSGLQITDDVRIAVAGTEIRYEEGVVKIPLEIITGQGARKVVVTVSAEVH